MTSDRARDREDGGWKRWILPLSAIPLLGLLGYGLLHSADTVPSRLVGQPAPEFTLETLSGDSLRLDDLTGERPLVLNFWATWCVPCIQEHRVLMDLERVHAGEVELAGVLYQDRAGNAEAWMRERGGGWPVLIDPGSDTAIRYGISGVPETFFITADGTVLHKHVGPVTAPVLQEWMPRLLAAGGE